jgi:hypothetical protein
MRVTAASGSEPEARGRSSVFQQTVTNTTTSYASYVYQPLIHVTQWTYPDNPEPDDAGFARKRAETDARIKNEHRLRMNEHIERIHDELKPTAQAYVRIIFATTQLVPAKLRSCATMKNAMDHTFRRCECGRVVQIRRRTRKFEITMESQPAYACELIMLDRNFVRCRNIPPKK